MPSTLEAIQVLLLFIIPGFIADQIIRLRNLKTQRDSTDSVLTYLGLSGLNAVIISPFLSFQIAPHNWWWQAGRLFLTVFLSPVLLALALRSDRAKKVLVLFGRAIHPHPKAWDHVFSTGRGSWVRVTLTDNKVIAGKFSPGSFVSSFPHVEDIFIATVYKLDEDNWFTVPHSGHGGILIRGDRIATIEFFEGSDPDVEQAADIEAVDNHYDREADREEGLRTEN